jgi:hypothetical protein
MLPAFHSFPTSLAMFKLSLVPISLDKISAKCITVTVLRQIQIHHLMNMIADSSPAHSVPLEVSPVSKVNVKQA